MALDISWLQEGLPIFGFVLVFALIYAILARTKILGESKAINSIISLVLGIIFISFSSVREYITNSVSVFTALLVISFFFLMLIVFIVIKDDWSKFTKPLGIVFIILMAIMLIAVVFYTFPSTRALLPGNYGESYADYNGYDCHYDNYDYFNKEDCYDKGNYWKCYTDSENKDYELYDNCLKSGSRYKCYDYEDRNCNDYNYNSDSNDIFTEIRDWFYREKITTAFWLLVVAAIAIFAVTRK